MKMMSISVQLLLFTKTKTIKNSFNFVIKLKLNNLNKR